MPAVIDNYTFDAGYYEYAAVGDSVWLDTYGDGIQEMSESSISDVTKITS